MQEHIKAAINWLSFEGRMGRHEFWLFYVAPQFALAALGAMLESQALTLLALYIGLVGLVRRIKDIQFKKSNLVVFAIIWVVISVVALVLVFIFFMGSISGPGDRDLLETATYIFFIPFLPVFLFPFILGSIPGMQNDNRYGPVPLKKSFDKRILIVISSLVLIIMIYKLLFTLTLPKEDPLIEAIMLGDAPETARLLNEGANPDQESLNGSTALIVAMKNEKFRMAEQLLNAGANPSLPATGSAFIEAIDNYSDYPWLIELMLEKGADVNHLNGRTGNLGPSVDFVRYNNEIINLLIKYGFDLNKAANRGTLMDAITLERYNRPVSKCHSLLKAELDSDQLQEALNFVQIRLKDYPDAVEFLTIEQLIKEKINKQSSKAIYPFDQFFKGPSVKIKGNPDFEERQFKRPVKVRANRDGRISIYEGPSTLYESVGEVKFGDFLYVTAITDVGDEFIWFKISYTNKEENESIEGYVSGEYLCSAGGWFRGLQHTYQFNDNYLEVELNK